jgi:hypothetical protein
MKVFVAVQPTPKGRVSSLSRYIADSKVERGREQLDERGSRPLFSAREDNLTFKEADEILNPTNRELEKKDVIHVVVSPEPGSIERAGDDDDERRATFIESIRDAIREMEVELNVKALSWIAGLHHNTRAPHAHIAVSRWAIDATTGKLRYIKHLPESLLPRHIEGEDGTKRLSTGKIAEVFAGSLNPKLKPIRSVRLTDKQRDTEISRSVLTRYDEMLREPTSEERVVGRWLETTLMLSQGVYGDVSRDDLLREHEALTNQVVQIDADARAQGARPPAAYIVPQRLEDLLSVKTNDVKVTVSTERVLPESEKYLDNVPVQPPEYEANQTVGTLDNGLPREAMKGPSLSGQQSERGSPSRESNSKVLTPKTERPKIERIRTDRIVAHRESVPSKSKGSQPQPKPDPPRVATRTLQELQKEISQNSNALHQPKGIEATTSKVTLTTTLTDAHSTVGNSQSSGPPPSNLEQVRSDKSPLVGAEEVRTAGSDLPKHEPEISDKTLTWITGITNLARTVMENSKSPARDYAEQLAVTNSDPWSIRLREIVLLDEVYDRACKQRGLTSDVRGVKDFVLDRYRSAFGSSSPQAVLWDEMSTARQHLDSVKEFATQNALDEYDRLHRDNPWLNPDPNERREEHEMNKNNSPSKEIGSAGAKIESGHEHTTETHEPAHDVIEVIL